MTEAKVKHYPLEVAVRQVDVVRSQLTEHSHEIEELIPMWSALTLSKLSSTVMQVLADNKSLMQCTGDSILRSVKMAAEFGLNFSKVLGQAYLVPYKTTATLIIGYRGMIELVHRAADVRSIDCGIVYKGDKFEVVGGTSPSLTHVPNLETPHRDSDITHVYAIAFYRDGHPHFEVMDRGEVDAIKARSKSGGRGPWVTDYAQMGVKCPIRRLFKYLPVSVERARLLEKALLHDDETGGIVPDAPFAVTPEERRAALFDSTPEEPEDADTTEWKGRNADIENLWKRIDAKREGEGMSDKAFVDAVVIQLFGQQTPVGNLTLAEFRVLAKALGDGIFDWATGDKIPENTDD